MIIRDSIFQKRIFAFFAREDSGARDAGGVGRANSKRHLGLQRERDELRALDRDARLPDRSAAALIDEGRVADASSQPARRR